MTVKFLGHACFLLTSDAGMRTMIDPYEPGAFGNALGYGPIEDEADLVLVTHDHADHSFVSGVPGSPRVCRDGSVIEELSMKALPAFHDQEGGRKRGSVYVYSFEMDGVRVCHVGDLGELLTDEQLAELGPVDVLMVPVGGTFTLDPAQAWALTEQVAPRVVIPMHYRTAKVTMPIETVDAFINGKTNVTRPLSSTVEFGADALPADREIVVLEPAN